MEKTDPLSYVYYIFIFFIIFHARTMTRLPVYVYTHTRIRHFFVAGYNIPVCPVYAT